MKQSCPAALFAAHNSSILQSPWFRTGNSSAVFFCRFQCSHACHGLQDRLSRRRKIGDPVSMFCLMLCCAVLCCAVLCCAALRCAVLCCAALCCIALWFAVLWHANMVARLKMSATRIHSELAQLQLSQHGHANHLLVVIHCLKPFSTTHC